MPLSDVTVIEFAGLGPSPFAGMVLAGLGADVIRIDRPGGPPIPDPMAGALGRGKRSIALDLKQPKAVEAALTILRESDILLEGFRPGVMERLGLGPDECLAANPLLVYGRMTGWGSGGPYAAMAGHDINFVGMSGALHAIGDEDRSVPPLNLVGDGGGALFLVAGLLAALHDRDRSGGTVVESAIVDGATSLMGPFYEMAAVGLWQDRRESNLLDGAAPFYTTYATSDGKAMAVGALEPHFYAALLEGLDIDPANLPPQCDRGRWPELRDTFAAVFATRSRDEWTEVFDGTDACTTPVLSMGEAPRHPQNTERGAFDGPDHHRLPAPNPRIGAQASRVLAPTRLPGADTGVVLTEFGFSAASIETLFDEGAAS
jgi:alpha-methylacyl-CoA racemase